MQNATTGARRAVIAAGGPLSVQPDATLLGVVATGTVDLRDRVHVTGGVAAPSLTVGNNVTVDGPRTTSGVPVTGKSISWTASTAAATVSSWDLQPGETLTLAPGRYGALAVKNSAKVTLSASGRYFFESLDLETGSTLSLTATDGPTEIYVHQNQLILRGTLTGSSNLEEQLAIVYAGSNEVFLEAPLRGAVIAPSAQVTLRSTTTLHRGSVFAKTVLLDARASLQPVAQTFLVGLGTGDVADCSWAIPPRSTGNRRSDEMQYQYEILKHCVMRGYPDDELRLRGIFNFEDGEAAAAMATCSIQPAQFIAFTRRRLDQIRQAVANPALARSMVAGPDADGDWVPDSSDSCSATPHFTPVDDNGCPMTLPEGPDCASVQALMGQMGMVINPACTEAEAMMPNIEFAVGLYVPRLPSEGVFLYVQDLPAQPVGCGSWYEFEIRAMQGNTVVDHYGVVFPYTSASHVGRFVANIPQPYVQLQALPTASGNVGRLGRTSQALVDRTLTELWYRVRAVSGMGTKGTWGSWMTSVPQDCRSIGLACR